MSSSIVQALIGVEGLAIERDDQILRGIDWQVRPGENWVILGPNGSGKSTLLNALMAFTAPTKGRLFAFGHEYGEDDWNEVKASIGYVGSEVNRMIEPDESALDVLISGARAMINFWGDPDPKEQRAARKILKNMGCSALEKRTWRQLSQGERQKMLFGRALMGKPRVLFLDEPCAGLDPIARLDYIRFMESNAVNPKGPALILVTHHVEEITPSFTHALLLREGHVVASGPMDGTLTSAKLSETFERAVRLLRRDGGYLLEEG
ncbi:MAG: ATP-binding cassette domain-containing protein [Opitutales bacterium]